MGIHPQEGDLQYDGSLSSPAPHPISRHTSAVITQGVRDQGLPSGKEGMGEGGITSTGFSSPHPRDIAAVFLTSRGSSPEAMRRGMALRGEGDPPIAHEGRRISP